VEKLSRAGETRDENVIKRKRFSCWITKATDILVTYNTYCFSTEIMFT